MTPAQGALPSRFIFHSHFLFLAAVVHVGAGSGKEAPFLNKFKFKKMGPFKVNW